MKAWDIVSGDDCSKSGKMAAVRAPFAANQLSKKWKGFCRNRQEHSTLNKLPRRKMPWRIGGLHVAHSL
jgi:hypothetical protein